MEECSAPFSEFLQSLELEYPRGNHKSFASYEPLGSEDRGHPRNGSSRLDIETTAPTRTTFSLHTVSRIRSMCWTGSVGENVTLLVGSQFWAIDGKSNEPIGSHFPLMRGNERVVLEGWTNGANANRLWGNIVKIRMVYSRLLCNSIEM
jgi:hypothetical protein